MVKDAVSSDRVFQGLQLLESKMIRGQRSEITATTV